MILVFNKCDITSPDFAKTWMTDFEAFNAASQAGERVYLSKCQIDADRWHVHVEFDTFHESCTGRIL